MIPFGIITVATKLIECGFQSHLLVRYLGPLVSAPASANSRAVHVALTRLHPRRRDTIDAAFHGPSEAYRRGSTEHTELCDFVPKLARFRAKQARPARPPLRQGQSRVRGESLAKRTASGLLD